MAEARDERLYLSDIKDAIDRILRYTSTGRKAFFADPMAQDAVVRNIEIVGEATRGVSEVLKKTHPDVPWRDISDMRNKVIHDYFRVDLDLLGED